MSSTVLLLAWLPLVVGCVAPPAASQDPGAAASGATQAAPTAVAAPGARALRFNRATLDDRGWQVITQLETATGRRLPDGDYWYDATCGAAGAMGGPALAILPAGLPLGGALPPDASGGGDGRLSGVFINGRELHPVDVQTLTQLIGQQAQPGRYWVDAQGNAGQEGGPALVNLYQLSQQRGGGRSWTHATQGPDGALYTGGDGSSSYFFDGASGCSVMDDGGGVQC